ncbi:MAG TPA: DUF362 domain-containing protein [Negativicutes bacterium]|nr:DUF362 domain-containing protein [Negativicutes bacterium]
MAATVIVSKMQEDNVLLSKQIEDTFPLLGLAEDFAKARAVFIKPNLTYPDYKPGVTTRVEFVEALVAALRRINQDTRIIIGEGEGGYHSFSMTQAMKTMGFGDIALRYPNVSIVNLSELPRHSVALRVKNSDYKMELPAVFFEEIDFSITCPVPKVHCMTGISLALKNQWGCVPDVMRLKNHYVFDYVIQQIAQVLKFRYVFLDGLWGLNDNGPMVGRTEKIGWFAAANSLLAHDRTIARMMRVDPETIGHLRSESRNEGVSIIGDLQGLAHSFALKRNLWNYPALVAFHSRWLTKLVYLSSCSKLIHDVMYCFRKRPTED